MRDLVAVDPDVVESVRSLMSIRMLGPGQAQLHHRQQAVPAGHEPGLGPEPLEQRDRVVDAGRPLVLERRWYLHGIPRSCCHSPRETSPNWSAARLE